MKKTERWCYVYSILFKPYRVPIFSRIFFKGLSFREFRVNRGKIPYCIFIFFWLCAYFFLRFPFGVYRGVFFLLFPICFL